MRQFLFIINLFLFCSCSHSLEGGFVNPKLSSKWTLTDVQAPGYGPSGIWSVASPVGRWFQFNADSTVSGTVFTGATRYSILDSATLKIIIPTEAVGFKLYNYQLDSINRVLYFYLRPPNGGYCFEGCGTLKFKSQ
ncbi:MAG: hypothetical protein EAZ13_03985 [Sphingobacteriia bacterium]|nr:MAG: hypothetical protein EAZ13_03985 [Sphingobacteriia bacterium]